LFHAVNDDAGPSERAPSLLGDNVRRSVVIGRTYLIIGIGYVTILSIIISLTSGAAFLQGVGLFLPVFAVVGAMGGMMVFTNDRLKGVFEYLIAYGVTPRRLFANVLIACLALSTIVLGVSLGVGLGLFLAAGHTISVQLVEVLGLYSLPMSYASVAFAATVGIFWTALSSPRSGMTSSVGLVPILGIAPSIITLGVIGVAGGFSLYIADGAVLLLAAFVISLLLLIDRLMPLERLLSQA
jgi:hypothetical protein